VRSSRLHYVFRFGSVGVPYASRYCDKGFAVSFGRQPNKEDSASRELMKENARDSDSWQGGMVIRYVGSVAR
jgi:hypothetical protein